ncbi:MAG: hypothetical protein M0R06_06870 [Sphaerochaeta sp.]|nr:hypothetical protein [Sphaerochaeta sp.]
MTSIEEDTQDLAMAAAIAAVVAAQPQATFRERAVLRLELGVSRHYRHEADAYGQRRYERH